MPTVASLNVVLSASSAAFSAGIGAAKSSLAGFLDFATSAQGIITGALGAIGIGLSAAAIKSFVAHQMEAIDATAKLSDRLGISTEKIVGLQHAADLSGVSVDELTGGLEKMLRALAGTSEEGNKTADAFTSLGLSMESLKAMAPDEAFAKIADGLAAMKSPSDRAAAAVAIFGKAGQSLLPLMLSGADGIREAQKQAELLGLTFSRFDAAKVEIANDSITVMDRVLTGVGRTLAIQVSPYVAAIAQQFTEFGTSGAGATGLVRNGLEYLVKGIAYASDFLNVFAAGWQVLRGAVGWTIGSIVDGIGTVIQGIEWLIGKLRGEAPTEFGKKMHEMGNAIIDVGEAAFTSAGEDWDAFMNRTNSKAVSSWFEDVNKKADSAAKGIADAAKGMNELQNAAAADPEWLAQMAKLDEEGKKLAESLRTPIEKYQDEIAHLNDLLNAGSIDEETYARALAKATGDLDAASKGEGKGQKLSVEARRFTFTVPGQEKQGDLQERIAKSNEEQLRTQKRHLEVAEKLLETMDGGLIEVASLN